MFMTSHRMFALPAALLGFAALAACGDGSGGDASSDGGGDDYAAQASVLFPDDFQAVCSGATVSRATAYDPAASSHKALYFATYRDDLLDQSSNLPGDWTVQWSPDGDALTAIDLVVCARRTAAQQVKVCDGYEVDNRSTQNTVRWHTATYEVSVREATTGTVLGETTMEATSSNCPMLMSFDGDSDTVDGYASLSDTAVADFVRPFIAP